MPRPVLPDVTLCCIDCAQPTLALAALRRSQVQAGFGATLLLTDAALVAEDIEVRPIARLSDRGAYSAFVLKQVRAHVATPHVLLVQWDGWVIDGARWEAGFREYDYVGAPWSWQPAGRQVGNGGFSLRSRRLLDALADDAFAPGDPEDALICRTWRPALEARGIRFADPATARRFSVEIESLAPRHDGGPSFGFHGLQHLWRAVPPAELPGLLAEIPAERLSGDGAVMLVAALIARDRWAEARAVLLAMERALGEAAATGRLDVLGDGAGLRARIHARGKPSLPR